MPLINGNYYSNPAYGQALERSRLAESFSGDRGAYGPQNESWFDRVVDHLTRPLPASPPSPAPPEPPAVITPGTPQNDLAQAQDDARTNDAYKPKFNRDGTLEASYCNQATCAIVKSQNGPMDALKYKDSGNTAVANDAARQLSKSPDWNEVSPQDAQRLANQGIVVIGVQPNTGLKDNGRPNHGHMVTVRPEIVPGLAESYGTAPVVNSIGKSREVLPAQQAFDRKLPPPRYYAPSRR